MFHTIIVNRLHKYILNINNLRMRSNSTAQFFETMSQHWEAAFPEIGDAPTRSRVVTLNALGL